MKTYVLLSLSLALTACAPDAGNTQSTSNDTITMTPEREIALPASIQKKYLFAVITVQEHKVTEEQHYIAGEMVTLPINEWDTVKYLSPIQEFDYVDRDVAMKFMDYYEDKVYRMLEQKSSFNNINSTQFYFTILARDSRLMTSYIEASNIYHTESGNIKRL